MARKGRLGAWTLSLGRPYNPWGRKEMASGGTKGARSGGLVLRLKKKGGRWEIHPLGFKLELGAEGLGPGRI